MPSEHSENSDSWGIGSLDLHLWNEGTHQRAHEMLGAHVGTWGGVFGTRFVVWAPNARSVTVPGDWNSWQAERTPLAPLGTAGVWAGLWAGFAPGVREGARYKLRIQSADGSATYKSDPFVFHQEQLPGTASIVHRFDYQWGDQEHMQARARPGARGSLAHDAPIAIYEAHLGSWQRGPSGEALSYRELAPRIARHVRMLGFTHVELMPVMEHPFGGSWGYQVTGYFAPTSRYGTPEDFMFFVDHLHQQGIGVILDWPPAHFASDTHGLGMFDGTFLYEHADEAQRVHPEWTSLIFNYGRNEVRSFLISNALFWLERYHIDGLRVDGVASMLYLDYARKSGEWIPNEQGGRENLAAVSLLRAVNTAVRARGDGAQIIAEESTSWPGVTAPVENGGLGFGFKWDLGWMHDTLRYLAREPVHRRYHHRELTFRGLYAFHEHFVLPLSHDEVVHGKGSLLRKMAGDVWQKHANLRLLLAFMYASPGKKLLFMGTELAGWDEWDEARALPLPLLAQPEHAGASKLLADLNALYQSQPALYQRDTEEGGLSWIEADDAEQSVIVIERRGYEGTEPVIVALNFTPVPRHGYRVPLHGGASGRYRELLNTDAEAYGGSGVGNLGVVFTQPDSHGDWCSLSLTLPPLSAVFLSRGA